jgi:hypothetical protein
MPESTPSFKLLEDCAPRDLIRINLGTRTDRPWQFSNPGEELPDDFAIISPLMFDPKWPTQERPDGPSFHHPYQQCARISQG